MHLTRMHVAALFAERRTVVAVSFVAAFFASLGSGFSLPRAVVFGGVLAVSALITGSWARAIFSFAAALGFAAIVMAIIARLPLPSAISAVSTIGVVVGLVYCAAIGASYLLRVPLGASISGTRSRVDLVGAGLSAAIGVYLLAKVDHAHSLLYLMLQEDNEAWVRVQTQIAGGGLGAGMLDYGASIGTFIAFTTGGMASGAPGPNAVWGVYSMLVILIPSFAACIAANIGGRTTWAIRSAVLVVASLLLVGFVFRFIEYGHLAAIAALVMLLAVIGFSVCVTPSVRATLPFLALVGFFSMCWFPFALFGAVALAYWVVRCYRIMDRSGRRYVVALSACTLVAVALPVRFVAANGPSGGIASLRALYEITGGTPEVDGSLLLCVVAALIAYAFYRASMPREAGIVIDLAALLIAYLIVVYAVGVILTHGVGYAQQKIAFTIVAGLATLVVLLLAAVDLDPRKAAMALGGILLVSMFIGGAAFGVLNRAWPPGGESPAWLSSLEAAIAQQKERGEKPHPVYCLTADVNVTYYCYRWSQGLSGSGSATLGGIASAVMTGGDPASATAAAIKSGEMANLDVLVLDRPATEAPWQKDLLANAHAIVGPDGRLLK